MTLQWWPCITRITGLSPVSMLGSLQGPAERGVGALKDTARSLKHCPIWRHATLQSPHLDGK